MRKALRSRRPYLIRAIYDWCVDGGFTPYITVQADYPGVSVPRQHVKDGIITLNISPLAVQAMAIDQNPMWFAARFGGRPFDLMVPPGAVLAIFAQEHGEGMIWGETEAADAAEDALPSPAPEPEVDPTPPTPPKSRSHLRVVK